MQSTFVVVISIGVYCRNSNYSPLVLQSCTVDWGKGQDVKGWHVYVKGAVAIVIRGGGRTYLIGYER